MGFLNSNALTAIKLVGFSEGAASVGVFLSRLAENPSLVSSTAAQQITTAILMETPTGLGRGPLGSEIDGFDYRELHGLPTALSNVGFNIRCVDMWNRASPVHGAILRGWESRSYDSRSFIEQAFSNFGWVGKAWRAGNTLKYHNDILKNQWTLNVLESIFK